MDRLIEKASVLIEALPYIKAFFGKAVVIKYGGAAMVEEGLKRSVILDVILMHYVGMRPILVHGGGPQIGRAMKQAGLEPKFVKGLRVTDEETMRIVEQVLVGEINQEIVSLINHHGGLAVGLSGKDGGLIRAKKASMVQGGEEVDLGLVGEVMSIAPAILRALERDGFIPVVAPTGFGEDGLTYNINADIVAGELAASLSAEKLVLLTDTDGILDEDGKLLSTLSRAQIEQLVLDGTLSEGMLPKVQACLTALNGGVRKTHIINGTIPHALLLEIFTEKGIGTEIVQ
ncbi:MAG: acetylglutamate kinase [candidate division NC10 bacterium]|nr:acetylglutamate kinase [candidate division NC10 bacterium]